MVATRLKVPDAKRLEAVVEARGLDTSGYVRAILLDAIEADASHMT